MTILVVDDDADDLEILIESIKAFDPKAVCHIAHTTHDAMHALASGLLPDVIFLDINMPMMDGMRCLENMRAIFDLKDTRIFIYTTAINDQQILQCKALNANWLVKPNSFSGIFESLQYILHDHPGNKKGLDR
jgi:CheY-like chemotaxis protein